MTYTSFSCQVCPECLEWADPNEGIPSFTLGGGGSEPIAASEIEACDPDINCHRSSSCETFEVVYRIRNSSACRGRSLLEFVKRNRYGETKSHCMVLMPIGLHDVSFLSVVKRLESFPRCSFQQKYEAIEGEKLI